MTGRRREPVLLYGVLLTAVGAFLAFTGSRDGNTATLIAGIVCLAFFGVSTIVLVAQRIGLIPGPGQRLVSRTGKDWAIPEVVRKGPKPTLSGEAREELERSIALLAAHGFFVPETPSAEQLEAAVADYGEPITASSVLSGVFSAPSYDPDLDIDRYTQNLRFHPLKMEQSSDVFERQMIDLRDLCDGALTIDDVTVDQSKFPIVRVAATVNGEPFESTYAGSNRWMSTVLIHDLAVIHERLELPSRLAAVNTEAGVYLTLLKRGAVEELAGAFTDEEDPGAQIFWMDDENFRYESGYPD